MESQTRNFALVDVRKTLAMRRQQELELEQRLELTSSDRKALGFHLWQQLVAKQLRN